jgi:hypothetical protein
MARSTFAGPILSGNSRFGPVRDVGYTNLVQSVQLNFANTGGNGTAGYAGGSGQFVNGNLIPNVNAVVYTNSSTAYPPTAATITADAATTVYRGAVMYLPVGSIIQDVFVDVGTSIATSGGTTTAAVVNIGNQFNGTQYGSATLTVATNTVTAGRYQPTFTGAQLNALYGTTADFTNPTGLVEPSTFSQVVFSLVVTGTTTPAPNAGTLILTLRYTQPDTNIGNATTYPYGNFD